MSGMQVVDFFEGTETNGEREPDRIVYQCGAGQRKTVTKKEFWVAVRAAKEFGIIGEKAPGVVPLTATK